MAVAFPLSKKKHKSCPFRATLWVALFFMKTPRSRLPYDFELLRLLAALVFTLVSLFASACSAVSTPTPFRPPTMEHPLIEPTRETVVVDATSTLATAVTGLPTTNPADCVNGLTFLEDLTVPDNMFVSFGLALDKQWRVENSGTCDWNSAYRLRNIGGAALGAPEEIALYPARAGTQATLRILFTAPFAEGVYESAWQAMDANGNPFGDPIYIRVTVQ
jgi:hypothetical protein